LRDDHVLARLLIRVFKQGAKRLKNASILGVALKFFFLHRQLDNRSTATTIPSSSTGRRVRNRRSQMKIAGQNERSTSTQDRGTQDRDVELEKVWGA